MRFCVIVVFLVASAAALPKTDVQPGESGAGHVVDYFEYLSEEDIEEGVSELDEYELVEESHEEGVSTSEEVGVLQGLDEDDLTLLEAVLEETTLLDVIQYILKLQQGGEEEVVSEESKLESAKSRSYKHYSGPGHVVDYFEDLYGEGPEEGISEMDEYEQVEESHEEEISTSEEVGVLQGLDEDDLTLLEAVLEETTLLDVIQYILKLQQEDEEEVATEESELESTKSRSYKRDCSTGSCGQTDDCPLCGLVTKCDNDRQRCELNCSLYDRVCKKICKCKHDRCMKHIRY